MRKFYIFAYFFVSYTSLFYFNRSNKMYYKFHYKFHVIEFKLYISNYARALRIFYINILSALNENF